MDLTQLQKVCESELATIAAAFLDEPSCREDLAKRSIVLERMAGLCSAALEVKRIRDLRARREALRALVRVRALRLEMRQREIHEFSRSFEAAARAKMAALPPRETVKGPSGLHARTESIRAIEDEMHRQAAATGRYFPLLDEVRAAQTAVDEAQSELAAIEQEINNAEHNCPDVISDSRGV